jgi:maleylpyruvate isomerase
VVSVVQTAAEFFERVVSGMSIDQVEQPSALPRWSRGHVIAHVVLNGEAFVAVARGLRSGQDAFMYSGGPAERDHDIDDLATRPLKEPLDRTRTANDALNDAWEPPPPIGECATGQGHPAFSSSTVLQRRLRELQVHLIDLGLDEVGLESWTDRFVDLDLQLQMVDRLSPASSMGPPGGVERQLHGTTAAPVMGPPRRQ